MNSELGTYWARYGVAWKEQPFTEHQRWVSALVDIQNWREVLIERWGGNDPLRRYAYSLTMPEGEPIAG